MCFFIPGELCDSSTNQKTVLWYQTMLFMFTAKSLNSGVHSLSLHQYPASLLLQRCSRRELTLIAGVAWFVFTIVDCQWTDSRYFLLLIRRSKKLELFGGLTLCLHEIGLAYIHKSQARVGLSRHFSPRVNRKNVMRFTKAGDASDGNCNSVTFLACGVLSKQRAIAEAVSRSLQVLLLSPLCVLVHYALQVLVQQNQTFRGCCCFLFCFGFVFFFDTDTALVQPLI